MKHLKKYEKGQSPEKSAKRRSKHILGRMDFQYGELQITSPSMQQLFPIILHILFNYETNGVLTQLKMFFYILKEFCRFTSHFKH